MRIGITGALAVAVVSALAGCSAPKGQYPIALAEALARLERADINGFRKARQCGFLIHFSAGRPDDHSIEWTVKSSGQKVARFTVSLSAVANGSQATIIVPKGADGAEIYDGRQHYSHPMLMQPLRPAVQELIDSAMDQRPYDWRRIPDPLNTDQLCGSELQNFEASGKPYELGDPEGMTHEAAVQAGLSQ